MDKDLSVHINLAGLTDAAQRSLQRAMNLVAVGLQADDGIGQASGRLPDATMAFQFASNEPWTAERTSAEWKQWVLLNGFRDAAESVSIVLEEARTVLAFWGLEKLQEQQGSLSGADWQRATVNEGRSFHRLGFPDKIASLERLYGVALEQDLKVRVLSIVKARNCLVHRGGVVSPRDVTYEHGLELSWLALAIIIKGPSGEREVELPAIAEGGETIAVGTRPRTRMFPIASSISVTSAEFTQICWTLFLFAKGLAKALEVRGKAMGLKFVDKAGAV